MTETMITCAFCTTEHQTDYSGFQKCYTKHINKIAQSTINGIEVEQFEDPQADWN